MSSVWRPNKSRHCLHLLRSDEPCACALPAGGAQLEAVGGVSGQVPPAALPADSGVCMGLAVCSLLDVSLCHRQHHAAVCAGGLRLVETVVSSCLQVQPDFTIRGGIVSAFQCCSKDHLDHLNNKWFELFHTFFKHVFRVLIDSFAALTENLHRQSVLLPSGLCRT